MFRIIMTLVLGLGWYSLCAEEMAYIDNTPFTTMFNCPIKGCTLECRRSGQETLLIENIHQLKMVSYRHSHTLFVMDMGMSKNRSVIINEGDLFCQVLDHK